MAPYPTPADITVMFEKLSGSDGEFLAFFDKAAQIEVMGHEHTTRGTAAGAEGMSNVIGSFEFIDWEKTSVKCRQVIGGGDSSWACAEVIGTGHSRKGKPIHHELAFVMNFSKEGRIIELRVYMDTAHVEDHFSHHKN